MTNLGYTKEFSLIQESSERFKFGDAGTGGTQHFSSERTFTRDKFGEL